jgi:HK97 family phage portal protein
MPPALPLVGDGRSVNFGIVGPWGDFASINPQAAEALAACAACVSLIAETIAALPAVVTLADDSRAVQPDHPLSRLAALGCNENESWSDLVASLLASALLRGNGLAELGTDGRGALASLTTIPFQHTVPWQNEAGELLFDYLPMTPPNAGKRRTLLRADLVLLKARSDNGALGISPLQRAANSMQLALETQRQTTQWLGNTARPGGFLAAPGKVSDPLAKRLGDEWQSMYTGEGKGRTAVLSEGLEFKPLGWMTAEDGQIVERLAYSVRDIARVFGVPVFMLADEQRSTFASATAALTFFATNCLRPWVVRLERAFQQAVLTNQYRLAIDLTALLRADPDAFAAALLKLRTGGMLTANEARTMLGLPAHPDGNTLTPPSVMSSKSPDAPPADGGARIIDLGQHRHERDSTD